MRIFDHLHLALFSSFQSVVRDGRAEALPRRRRLSRRCPSFDERVDLILHKFEAALAQKFVLNGISTWALSVSEELSVAPLKVSILDLIHVVDLHTLVHCWVLSELRM